MEKIAWDGPKWGPRGLFPANPDLADILGRTDLDFENLIFEIFGFPNSGFPGFRFPKSGPGRAWAGLEPSGRKSVGFLL